jgi:dTMP kinase
VGEGKSGWLIAFEGIDGAGKTTQANLLAETLRARGHTVVLTKEPTSGPHGQKIRELSTAGADFTPEDELGYFIEDRKEHLRDLIGPALAEGKVVITDRYYLSNVAYQGARGLDPEDILARNEALFPAPAAVVLIEVSPEEGLRRVRARGGALNLSYEREDFLSGVVRVFGTVKRDYLHRIAGERTVDTVREDVWAIVEAVMRD